MMRSGVPIGMSLASWRILSLRTRTQPCDGRPGMRPGWLVPWIPTTPPLGQSESARVGARAEGPRTVRAAVALQPLADPERAARRRRRGLADPDRRLPDPAAVLVERRLLRRAVDDELRAHDVEVAQHLRRDPAGPAVRAHRDADAQPRLAVGVELALQDEVDLGQLVLGEEAQARDRARAAARRDADRIGLARVRPARDLLLVGQRSACRPAPRARPSDRATAGPSAIGVDCALALDASTAASSANSASSVEIVLVVVVSAITPGSPLPRPGVDASGLTGHTRPHRLSDHGLEPMRALSRGLIRRDQPGATSGVIRLSVARRQ